MFADLQDAGFANTGSTSAQGWDRAVDDGWISNGAETGEWISGLMDSCLTRIDLLISARPYDAWERGHVERMDYWCRILIACRETD